MEYIVEVKDPNPTTELNGLNIVLITIQGNENTVKDLLDLINCGFDIIKCKNTACKSMIKTKEQMERGLK